MSIPFGSETTYFVLVDQQQHGPYPFDQLQDLWRKGIVAPETLFWTQGQDGWQPLAKMSSRLGTLPTNNLQNLLPPSVGGTAPMRSANVIPQTITLPGTKTSGLAIASLVCGIAGLLIGLPALLAVILGHMARGRIKKSAGALKGSSQALTGLVLGYLVLGAFIGLTGLMAFADRHHGPELNDLHHAQLIADSIHLYTLDHQGRTPANLAALVPSYVPSQADLVSPLATDTAAAGYELMLPDTDLSTIKDPAHTVLLQGRYKSARGYRVYVYADGYGTTKHENP